MNRQAHPPMTDARLDRLISELLSERADDVAAAAQSTDAMVERMVALNRPFGSSRALVVLAAAALLTAVVIGGTLAVGGMLRGPLLQVPAPQASASGDPPVVRGWPDTSENEPGIYSWDAADCGDFCVMGFMHNGYGSGDAEIRIDVAPGTKPSAEATPITIAGHDGFHQEVGDVRELWLVDIEGTTIAIRLTKRVGISQADLEEAHAIIASMRTEAHDNALGFRLLFTLTTDDWDSG